MKQRCCILRQSRPASAGPHRALTAPATPARPAASWPQSRQVAPDASPRCPGSGRGPCAAISLACSRQTIAGWAWQAAAAASARFWRRHRLTCIARAWLSTAEANRARSSVEASWPVGDCFGRISGTSESWLAEVAGLPARASTGEGGPPALAAPAESRALLGRGPADGLSTSSGSGGAAGTAGAEASGLRVPPLPPPLPGAAGSPPVSMVWRGRPSAVVRGRYQCPALSRGPGRLAWRAVSGRGWAWLAHTHDVRGL